MSVVYVADPAAVSRLVRGFHGTDNPYWRWAGRESSVIMNPPKGANQRGAVLVLHIGVVEAVLASVKSQNLFATIDGVALPVQHYDKPGQFTLRQDVPAAALQFDPVRVDFTVDKALPRTGTDPLEHAIIISHVELEPK